MRLRALKLSFIRLIVLRISTLRLLELTMKPLGLSVSGIRTLRQFFERTWTLGHFILRIRTL